MSKLTGKAIIKINGQQYQTKSGAELDTGKGNRTTVLAESGVAGYTEQVAQPKITCAIIHDSTINLDALAQITDATVVFECDSGKVYSIAPAWVVSGIGIKTSNDGSAVDLEIEGAVCEEVA